MNHHTYKKIEVVGCSSRGIEDAIQNATSKAHESVRNLRWFEVDEIRGQIKEGNVTEWQVGLKLAFTLEDDRSVENPTAKAIAEGFGESPSGITLETQPRKPLSES